MKSNILIAYLNILILIIVVKAGTLDLIDNVLPILNEGNSLTEMENENSEDIHLPFPQLVRKYGYSVEEHEVKTSDEYLLTMFRIPKKGPAVLLMHGGLQSADDYVTIGTQAGLAYHLADAGFDVWLGNSRGTKYSLGHVKLSTSSAAYWDFTFDEMGRYDTAAMIDYILKATNAKDLKLIGYSQSTDANLVLCSEKPEYNDKISVIVLISPTIFFVNTKLYLAKLLAGPLTPDLYLLAKSLGIHSLFTDRELGPIASFYTSTFCATPETADIYCYTPLSLLFGRNHDQVNATSLPIIFGHMPTSTSIKLFQHTFQLIRAKQFRQYDYGKASNLIKYGSSEPPEYALDKVTTKVAILWAKSDKVCEEKDLEILLNILPNVVDVYKVPQDEFTHIDFTYAKDVKTLAYDKLTEILKSN